MEVKQEGPLAPSMTESDHPSSHDAWTPRVRPVPCPVAPHSPQTPVCRLGVDSPNESPGVPVGVARVEAAGDTLLKLTIVTSTAWRPRRRAQVLDFDFDRRVVYLVLTR